MPVISALRSLRQEDPDLSFDASENLKTIYKGKKKKNSVTTTPRIYLSGGRDN